MDEQYYWELTLMGGDKILIPPKYVETVKRKWRAGENIATDRQEVAAHQIINFERTSRLYTNQKMLEDVAQAFKEPIIRHREFSDGTSDEAVAVKWVKKQVTQREWEKYYSPHGYRRLNSIPGLVIVAFRCPTHQVNLDRVQYCTPDEITKLTK